MIDLTVDPAFKIKIWEHGEQVDVREHGRDFKLELRPIEAHMKVDGAVAPDGADAPIFCFVLRDCDGFAYYAQISERMMSPLLEAMAYKKIKGDGKVVMPLLQDCPVCGAEAGSFLDIRVWEMGCIYDIGCGFVVRGLNTELALSKVWNEIKVGGNSKRTRGCSW